MTMILLILAGGVGAATRFSLTGRIPHEAGSVPRATTVINLLGAVSLGLLLGTSAGGGTVSVVGTGFLGGFTTFSTWMLESLSLSYRVAFLNVIVVPAAGLILAMLALAASA